MAQGGRRGARPFQHFKELVGLRGLQEEQEGEVGGSKRRLKEGNTPAGKGFAEAWGQRRSRPFPVGSREGEERVGVFGALPRPPGFEPTGCTRARPRVFPAQPPRWEMTLGSPCPRPASVSPWVLSVAAARPGRQPEKARRGGRARVGAGPPTAAGRDLPNTSRLRTGLLLLPYTPSPSPGGGRSSGSWRPRSCSLCTCRRQTARARPIRRPCPTAAAARRRSPSRARAALP